MKLVDSGVISEPAEFIFNNKCCSYQALFVFSYEAVRFIMNTLYVYKILRIHVMI